MSSNVYNNFRCWWSWSTTLRIPVRWEWKRITLGITSVGAQTEFNVSTQTAARARDLDSLNAEYDTQWWDSVSRVGAGVLSSDIHDGLTKIRLITSLFDRVSAMKPFEACVPFRHTRDASVGMVVPSHSPSIIRSSSWEESLAVGSKCRRIVQRHTRLDANTAYHINIRLSFSNEMCSVPFRHTIERLLTPFNNSIEFARRKLSILVFARNEECEHRQYETGEKIGEEKVDEQYKRYEVPSRWEIRGQYRIVCT